MNPGKKLPVLSIPHGGGPWPFMKDSFGDPRPFESLEAYLKNIGNEFKDQIKSLLVISAHWEETLPTVHFGKNPGMLYDYGGFPDFAYSLKWPAPGSPQTALRVKELLEKAGIATAREDHRGYDHGTFIPLMLAFPEAQIPTAQLSLVRTLDPSIHIRIGETLEPLREEGVLIIASGMSYHNMRGFGRGSPHILETSRNFDRWLEESVKAPRYERKERLEAWKTGPGALECHPRSEHLVPLFVAAGAAGEDTGRLDWRDELMGTTVSGHRFG